MRICRRTAGWTAPAAALAALLAAGSLLAGPREKSAVFRGEVVRFDSTSITVRNPRMPLLLRTFTYSPKLREKVARILETGEYPYGEMVKVRYVAGEVAVAIRGRAVKMRTGTKAARKPG